MLHGATRVAGRPPAKSFKGPLVHFSTSSHLYAKKESSALTKVYAFTSIVDGVHADLHEVTYIRTKVASDKVDNVEMSPDAADCPWACELPYVISDWSDTHVRIDCHVDSSFWCSFPETMLPTPFVSSPSEASQASDSRLYHDDGLCTQSDAAVETEAETDVRG